MHHVAASVVVPTWRRAPWLDRCLQALVRQVPAPAEVIVVGRAEDREAQEVAGRHAAQANFPLSWVTVRRPGHLAPIRCGLQAVRYPVVAFVDDDAEAEVGWLAALLEPFDQPDVACVGGRVMTEKSDSKAAPDAGRIRWYGKYVGNVGALEARAPVRVAGVMEGNWAWRVRVLRTLHFDSLFDSDDGINYGLDLGLQAIAQGYQVVYTSSARVLHHLAPRDSSLARGRELTRRFTYGRNYTYIGLKHYRRLRRFFFLLWWFGVGERQSYGLLKGLYDLPRGPWRMSRLLIASFSGRAAGVRAWRRWRGTLQGSR